MDRQDELWKRQDQLIDETEFLLEAFKEGSPIYEVVTDSFPTIESFIGQSTLETSDGSPGYTLQAENGETIFIQCFSDNKQINTYLRDGEIVRYQFLRVNVELDTPKKRLNKFSENVKELKEIQDELDKFEKEQTDE